MSKVSECTRLGEPCAEPSLGLGLASLLLSSSLATWRRNSQTLIYKRISELMYVRRFPVHNECIYFRLFQYLSNLRLDVSAVALSASFHLLPYVSSRRVLRRDRRAIVRFTEPLALKDVLRVLTLHVTRYRRRVGHAVRTLSSCISFQDVPFIQDRIFFLFPAPRGLKIWSLVAHIPQVRWCESSQLLARGC